MKTLPRSAFSVRSGPFQVHSVAFFRFVEHSHLLFLQGRHYERRVDALALRADEGRGIAAISVGEPLAGFDPTISEWGNPTTIWWLPPPREVEGTGGTETSHYPEEQIVCP
jgi:hypothetical protein